MVLTQLLEQIAGLGIFLIGLSLFVLSLKAYRRERDSKMLIVSIAYVLFSIHGFFLFIEYFLIGYQILSINTIELLEHTSSFLILIGLLTFFIAITRK